TDFGLARRRPVEGDTSDAELQGELPCYLAPEQAWGRAKEIGPATDIYALGAILYELMTGQPPFREATATETLDAIQGREPRPPSRLRSAVSSDLDTICRKCLTKQPRRRYASALDLAEDLRRCAAGHPIKARVTGNAERLGKWLRRNVRGIALVVLGLCLGAALMGLINVGGDDSAPPSREHGFRQTISRLESDLREARRQQSNADYLRYLLLAERAADSREKERGLEMLERCPKELRHWEWDYLYSYLQGVPRFMTCFPTGWPITCMDVSRDGLYVALGGSLKRPNEAGERKGAVLVWPLGEDGRLWRWQMPGLVRSVAFRRDNASLAMIHGSDQADRKTTLEARYIQTGMAVCAPRLFTDCTPTSLAYSTDSRSLLVMADDDQLRVLQANNLANMRIVPTPFLPFRLPDPHGRILAMPTPSAADRFALIGPDGSQILVLSDLQRRDVLLDFRNHDNSIYSALAYDQQGDKLAAGGTATEILLWDMRFPYQAPQRLRGHKDAVKGLSFSSDGKRLASCGADGTVRIWDAEQGLELLTLKDYPRASGVLFHLASRALDGMDPRTKVSLEADRLAIAHGNNVTIIFPRKSPPLAD
ncbi:MAG TPA: protein kinase, partial [Gemmataceae bacterium]|nr:protein kinase [Gemmataceae bacterium]